MKKFLLCFIILFTGLQVTAATTNWDATTQKTRLNNVAGRIIKANNLPSGISIKLSEKEDANAYANINKEIYIYKGLLNYVENDEELAAVIAHEMGHIINGHNAKQTLMNASLTNLANSIATEKNSTSVAVAHQLSVSKLSRNDEFEADLTATDLLVKAKYNPLALISVLNKINENYLDVFNSHPSGEKRIMNIYDYIDYNYKNYTKTSYKTNSYQNASALINATLAIRNSNTKKIAKVQKTQAKLKQKKLKRAKKMLNANNGWDTSYTVLQLMSTP